MTAKEAIDTLQLQPHPEGGFYKETYRSTQSIIAPNGTQRNMGTAIYYLLENEDRSHFHRIASDEIWFFHEGQPLEIICIMDGRIDIILLGTDLANSETPQAVIPANTWFGARVKDGAGHALVSCTVAPGFDFADFEMADRERLLQEFPQLHEWVLAFTR